MSNTTIVVIIGILILNLIAIGVSLFKILIKANKPGWGVLIPIYNLYLLVKIAGKPGWWTVSFILWGLIPGLNVLGILGLFIVVSIALARRFNHGSLFGLGMVFLAIFFWPILAFGDEKYTPAPINENLPDDNKKNGKYWEQQRLEKQQQGLQRLEEQRLEEQRLEEQRLEEQRLEKKQLEKQRSKEKLIEEKLLGKKEKKKKTGKEKPPKKGWFKKKYVENDYEGESKFDRLLD